MTLRYIVVVFSYPTCWWLGSPKACVEWSIPALSNFFLSHVQANYFVRYHSAVDSRYPRRTCNCRHIWWHYGILWFFLVLSDLLMTLLPQSLHWVLWDSRVQDFFSVPCAFFLSDILVSNTTFLLRVCALYSTPMCLSSCCLSHYHHLSYCSQYIVRIWLSLCLSLEISQSLATVQAAGAPICIGRSGINGSQHHHNIWADEWKDYAARSGTSSLPQ